MAISGHSRWLPQMHSAPAHTVSAFTRDGGHVSSHLRTAPQLMAAKHTVESKLASMCINMHAGEDHCRDRARKGLASSATTARIREEHCGWAMRAYANMTKSSTTNSTKEPTGGKRPIYFLHLHRSGGTSICEQMQRTFHLRVTSLGGNCNLLPGDGPRSLLRGCWGASESELSCNDRARLARHMKLGFFAVEKWLSTPTCTEDLAYATMLRSPLARIRARQCMNMDVGQTAAVLTHWLDEATGSSAHNGVRLPFAGYPDLDQSEILVAGPTAISNFVTRALLGHRDFYTPPSRLIREASLGERALVRALETLFGTFEAVGVIEEVNCTANPLQTLARTHGASSDVNSHRRSARLRMMHEPDEAAEAATPRSNAVSYELCSTPTYAWSPALHAQMCAANTLDLALYAVFSRGGSCRWAKRAGAHGRMCGHAAQEWMGFCTMNQSGCTSSPALRSSCAVAQEWVCSQHKA